MLEEMILNRAKSEVGLFKGFVPMGILEERPSLSTLPKSKHL